MEKTGTFGCASGALGPREEAEALRAVLRREPDNLPVLTKLGQTLLKLKDPDVLDEAEVHARRALALPAGSPGLLELLGRVLGAQGRFSEALECFKEALKRLPGDVSIRCLLGELLRSCGRFDEAGRILAEAVSIDPNDARARAEIGALAIARRQFAEAEEHFRAALERDGTLAEARLGLGLALEEQGQLAKAEDCFHDALRSDPGLTGPLIALARLQAGRGDAEESCRTLRRALAVCPNLAEGYWRLAMNLKGALPDSDIEAIERLSQHKFVPDGLRAGLGFALGAVFDARGLYAQAAEQFAAANALKAAVKVAKGQSFDPGEYSRSIDRIITTFGPELLARGRGWGDPDPRPVFVVGLPRSGTTLVEQILASHSQVHGAGELHHVINLFNGLPGSLGRPGLDAFEAPRALGPDSAEAVARSYLAALDTLAPATAKRIVDKMPDNFLMLGMIAVLWPRARVIVCSRDLRDVALSCWQTPFGTNPWTNQLEHIARRLADHQRLLAHWKRTKPVEWLDVVYEELVHDLEGHARRMISFLGLEWEPACLEFHQTRRVVRSASQFQVREPIHTHSVGRWRRYESTLRPLFQALGRYA